jgi:hypothetical protein
MRDILYGLKSYSTLRFYKCILTCKLCLWQDKNPINFRNVTNSFSIYIIVSIRPSNNVKNENIIHDLQRL